MAERPAAAAPRAAAAQVFVAREEASHAAAAVSGPADERSWSAAAAVGKLEAAQEAVAQASAYQAPAAGAAATPPDAFDDLPDISTLSLLSLPVMALTENPMYIVRPHAHGIRICPQKKVG